MDSQHASRELALRRATSPKGRQERLACETSGRAVECVGRHEMAFSERGWWCRASRALSVRCWPMLGGCFKSLGFSTLGLGCASIAGTVLRRDAWTSRRRVLDFGVLGAQYAIRTRTLCIIGRVSAPPFHAALDTHSLCAQPPAAVVLAVPRKLAAFPRRVSGVGTGHRTTGAEGVAPDPEPRRISARPTRH